MGSPFMVLFILGLCNAAFGSVQLNDDILGLVLFKADVIDPTNALQTWTEDEYNPCNWMGIRCNAYNSRVNSIHLNGLSLSGHIGRGFGKLEYLQTLSLAYNNFSGTLDAEPFQLKELQEINLSHNMLSGPISLSFSALGSLKSLDLSSNKLSGTIPEEFFFTCSSLQYISLAQNALEGAVPDSIHICQGLRVLNLSSNHFTNALPASFGLLRRLLMLDFSYNAFSGTISGFLSAFTDLVDARIQSNQFSGMIPDDIGLCVALQRLDMSDNLLSGSLPISMQQLKSLISLNLASNSLVGNLPSWIGKANLKTLDLSSNNFVGTIPDELLFPSLVSLRLSDNQLSGKLPNSFYSQCWSLQVLDLAQNHLEGTVPLLGMCPRVSYFNISGNLFSGSLPSFVKDSTLQMVDISHNQVDGSIPTTINVASRLSVLLLNHNHLGGALPPELGRCTALTYINLSQNHLIGSIPAELGNLKSLQVLDLSYNNISGSIPKVLGDLQRLETLDLSYNLLKGAIPESGSFSRFNKTAYRGDDQLCGTKINVPCPAIPSYQNASHTMLSALGILAICAAAAIPLGVVVVLLLNTYVQSQPGPTVQISDSLPQSASSDLALGKLVMFTENPDPRSAEWVTSAHALLNKDRELGRGGFGTVYKAVLTDGRIVAIKKLTIPSIMTSQAEFEKGIQSLGKVKHGNVLALQGYYWTPQLQLLIYDFIPNGSLYSRLHERSSMDAPLSWQIRFKIVLGIAQGLAYLHHVCVPQIIHYNMKSSNVLLDEGINPKLSDYGMAKLLPILDKSKFQSALGYMAPEFVSDSLCITEKCDVYAFGVLLLELVTGRRPVDYMEDDVAVMCDYVRCLLDEGRALACVDAAMQDCVDDEVLPMMRLGLVCTSQLPANRPSMAEVVQILELIRNSSE